LRKPGSPGLFLWPSPAVAVGEGVKLVSDTARAFGNRGLGGTVNAHMDANDSCAGGSSGVAEVNAAVNHMDQATPQSAAMVGQTPVAAANKHPR
jgi:methyl-accepting chemotaxis protein